MRVNDDAGATAVESALIVPLIILIMFAVVEFGFWIMSSSQARSAASDGARVAMLNPLAETDILDAVNSRVPPGTFEDDDIAISCPSPCTVSSGASVTVSVTWDREWLTPIPSLLNLSTGTAEMQVSGTAVRRLVGDPH